ncbi:MAG: UDP-N-acetylglucosamine 2-epimerase (non-hydrolyzing) [Planctomycetales bacterium]|nr:UDP-N-acetylglucosamine 2-epimerase (non-hydrolyzing) [bacterium]UNM09201.1 MAG: UDP-N-acetylglucosamine 2-epimerase (non-hydrolyzing) [Planctomycetales bacterium]
MKRPLVASIFGTRPEAIKMAPVVRLLIDDPDIDFELIVTAQHRGLLDDVLELFQLTPAVDLNLMQEEQSLDYITAGVLNGVGAALDRLQPDLVLVHGDTTTSFAAALAAFHRRIPVGHVEAGLRTSTIQEPFPEEFNRRAVDMLAAQYYCPTSEAAANLANRGVFGGEVHVTGNTALDAVRVAARDDYRFPDELQDYTRHVGPKLLVTSHRRENWGSNMDSICEGIKGILSDHPTAMACFCWHPNPQLRNQIRSHLGGHGRVLLTDPPRFDAFVNLMRVSDLILTDSGGIQEEITMLGRFALVLRRETERPEAVAAGYTRVVGTAASEIRNAAREELPRLLRGDHPHAPSPFGDGRASERILEAVRGLLLRAGLG